MARRKVNTSTAKSLLNALNFISVAQTEKESPNAYENHCVLSDGYATAYNGIITAGCKIEEAFSICPHTYKLIHALEHCQKDISITELAGRLSVKSGAFSAFVPCWEGDRPLVTPDAPCGQISDALKVGFETIGYLAVENGKTVAQASILLRNGSMVATDRFLIMEYWHGLSMPKIVLPKLFISAIVSIPKKLVQFGFSDNSVTFYFEDSSWVKTQLFEEEWPDVDPILNIASKQEPLPADFYTALSTIASFSSGKKGEQKVYFMDGKMQTHRDEKEGASYEVEGLKMGPAFGIERLKRIEKYIKTADFYSHSTMFFFGDNLRGCLTGVR